MKKILKIFMIAALSAGLFTSADAQRSRESRGGSSPRVSNGPTRSFTPMRAETQRSEPARVFNNNSRPSVTVRDQSNTRMENNRVEGAQQRRSPVIANSTQRTVASPGNYAMRGERTSTYRNTNTYRNGTSTYRNDNTYHNNRGYYGNVYGHRTAFMYGTRYRVIPHSFISIRFGGNPYYYNSGYFYGYYGGYYQPIFPPFGVRIGILPFGYSSFYWGGNPFYYYNGIYYRQYQDSYEVVDAPMGAVVSSLPNGVRTVVINGETLYELNGTFYRADQEANGSVVYTVIGKNGVVNNSQDISGYNSQAPVGVQPGTSLQVGDIISQLPEGSKVVTINGKQLYETPDNIYLEEQSNNGMVGYKVVGQ
ncbi:MAG: DUF6515 family protein [Ginsengibacter sp.]